LRIAQADSHQRPLNTAADGRVISLGNGEPGWLWAGLWLLQRQQTSENNTGFSARKAGSWGNAVLVLRVIAYAVAISLSVRSPGS